MATYRFTAHFEGSQAQCDALKSFYDALVAPKCLEAVPPAPANHDVGVVAPSGDNYVFDAETWFTNIHDADGAKSVYDAYQAEVFGAFYSSFIASRFSARSDL
jgi:hypothetical protein